MAKRKLSQTDVSTSSKRPRKKERREEEKILAVEDAPFHGHSIIQCRLCHINDWLTLIQVAGRRLRSLSKWTNNLSNNLP